MAVARSGAARGERRWRGRRGGRHGWYWRRSYPGQAQRKHQEERETSAHSRPSGATPAADGPSLSPGRPLPHARLARGDWRDRRDVGRQPVLTSPGTATGLLGRGATGRPHSEHDLPTPTTAQTRFVDPLDTWLALGTLGVFPDKTVKPRGRLAF